MNSYHHKKVSSKIELPRRLAFDRDTTIRSSFRYDYLACDLPNRGGRVELCINTSGANCNCCHFSDDSSVTATNSEMAQVPGYLPVCSDCVPMQNCQDPLLYYAYAENGVLANTTSQGPNPAFHQSLSMWPYQFVQEPYTNSLLAERSPFYPGNNAYHASPQSDAKTSSSTARDRILVYVPTYGDKDSNISDGSRNSELLLEYDSCEKRAIIVKHVPSHLNKVGVLCDFFQQFGPIVEININIRNGVSARIEFKNAADAAAAYASPIPVLGNRFIEVLWEDEIQSNTSEKCQSIPKDGKTVAKRIVRSNCDKNSFQCGLYKKSSSKAVDNLSILQERKLAFVTKCKKLEKILAAKQSKISSSEHLKTLCEEFSDKCKSNISYFEASAKKERLPHRRPNGDKLKKTMMKNLLDLEMDLYFLEKRATMPLDLTGKVRKLEEELMEN